MIATKLLARMSPRRCERDEATLAALAGAGDEAAFEELVRRAHPAVWRVAVRMVGESDAPDLVQETFVAAYRTLDRFEPGRPFSPWVVTIATRRCLNWLRTRRRRPSEPLDPTLPAARPDPGEEAGRRDQARRLQSALEHLDPRSRALVVLHYCEGYTGPELAESLGMSHSAVKVALFRARKRLRELLSKGEPR